MRTFVVAAASAIFFAAVVVELSSRLWPGSYLALLLVAAVGLFFNGLLNGRLAAGSAPARAQQGARRSGGRERDGDRNRDRKRSQGRSASASSSKAEPRGESRSRQKAEAQAPASDGPRENGEVKWFNRNKGFGFIIRESGEEIFVHQRSIRLVGDGDSRRRPTLRDGQAVSFQVAERDKGIQAEDVVPVD